MNTGKEKKAQLKFFLLCLFLEVSLTFLSPVFAAEFDSQIKKQQESLQQLKNQIEEGRKELANLEAKKTEVHEQLQVLTENMRLTKEYLGGLEQTEQTLNASLDSLRSQIKSLEKRIRERKKVMSERIRTLFIKGNPKQMMFGHWKNGETDLFRKLFFTKKVVEFDQSLVLADQKDSEIKNQKITELDERLAEVNEFRKHKTQEVSVYSAMHQEQKVALSSLQENVEMKNKALQEMEDNAKKLTKIITELEKRRKEALAQKKKPKPAPSGNLCNPLEGKVVSRYGLQYHTTLKTQTKNLGIEIQSTSGTPVVAAANGEVALVTEIPGYGPGVILDNGGGTYTIYANLESVGVKQGQQVKACQELGKVSGTRASMRDRLYFEVRKGTETVDPQVWLKR